MLLMAANPLQTMAKRPRISSLLLFLAAFVAPCGALSLFRPLKTPDEFRRAMQTAEERDQLTVLAIKKPRCLACRAVAAPLDQLAKRNPTVDFVSLEVDYKNDKLARALCDSLGVEAVPYVFVVNGGEGTADAFICGVTSVERLQRTLHRCAPDGCPHDADFGI